MIFNFSNHIREKRDFVSGGAAAGVAGTVTYVIYVYTNCLIYDKLLISLILSQSIFSK